VKSKEPVLDGGADPSREGTLLSGHVPAHCNVATMNAVLIVHRDSEAAFCQIILDTCWASFLCYV